MVSHLTSHSLPFLRTCLSTRGLTTSPGALLVGKPFFKGTEHIQPGWKRGSGHPGLGDFIAGSEQSPCKTPSLMKAGPPPTTTTHSLPRKSASYKTRLGGRVLILGSSSPQPHHREPSGARAAGEVCTMLLRQVPRDHGAWPSHPSGDTAVWGLPGPSCL